MKNINDYKKRFYNLMESTIGDVKPLINEEILPNPWTDTTTALQGIADYYNTQLTNYYTKKPDKPKIYFSVKRTHSTDGAGNETDVAWQSFFGNKLLSTDKLPSYYIIDQKNLVATPNMTRFINEFIATPISMKYRSITNGAPTTGVVVQVNTAVAAINVALKKAKNPTRPK